MATRRFLCILHSVRPELALFALVDYDPHGIAILRTYEHGSKRLDHEDNVTIPEIKWLGLRNFDVLTNHFNLGDQELGESESQLSQDISSHVFVDYEYSYKGMCSSLD